MGWYYGYGRYKPSKPRKAKGGIKAQGTFGGKWWSERWIKALESYSHEWSSRLQRGRSYARGGQVLDYSINDGVITAKVQGSRPKPYSITIQLKSISDADWKKVTAKMSSKAVFSAKLLTGEMPQNIEDAFSSAGVSLFPKSPREIKSECSCPDFANPCKHIAAVFYILAEEFDRNPFMIFQVRGRDRESLLSELRQQRAGSEDEEQVKKRATQGSEIEGKIRFDESFWKMGAAAKGLQITIEEPVVEMSTLKRLGIPPFWAIKKDFMKEMSRLYKTVSERSMEIAYKGEKEGEKQA